MGESVRESEGEGEGERAIETNRTKRKEGFQPSINLDTLLFHHTIRLLFKNSSS